MSGMQKVILIEECQNLYSLIANIADAHAEGASSILFWSRTNESGLFQSPDELALVERYARKFGMEINLSAANNPTLRKMAGQVGWRVFWQMPEMDALLERQAIQQEANQWQYREREKADLEAAG